MPLSNQLESIKRFFSILEKLLNRSPSQESHLSYYISSSNLLNQAGYLISEIEIKLGNIKPHPPTL